MNKVGNKPKHFGSSASPIQHSNTHHSALEMSCGENIMATEKIQGILDTVGNLSVLELNELVKELQEQWGVTAAVATAPAAGGGGGAVEAAAPVEEQTEFSVIIKEAGAQKIQVIKAVREVVPSLGLKEAKDVVDAAPKAVLENATKEDAQKAKEKLEAAGAVVEIK